MSISDQRETEPPAATRAPPLRSPREDRLVRAANRAYELYRERECRDGSVIKGEKKREEEMKEDDYYCCEWSFGAFTRAVNLPCDVKAEQVKASVKNGVLEVRLPKTEDAKKKAVTVKIE
ncbi:MAG: Hsp20/alpha crystallin family protein [Nitrospiraceae bacterium]